MLTAVCVLLVVAFAVPVGASVGGSGFGSTLLAVAWPLLVTTMVRVKPEPRRMGVGDAVKLVTKSVAGVWTVRRLESMAGAVTAAALLASVPCAPPLRLI